MKRLRNNIRFFLAAGFIISTAVLFGDSVRITQIDTSRLLTSQRVGLYLDVSGDAGTVIPDLTADQFSVFESSDGENYREVPRIEGLRTQPNLTEGINFLLLIDNSGSMYDSVNGQPTNDPAAMKITEAKQAVRSFLSNVSNPKDTVGLVAFNTFYKTISPPEAENRNLSTYLDDIERPIPYEAYTELYGSLYLASDYMGDFNGRKVVIVLSDGENYPLVVHSDNVHPRFGDRVFEYTEAIDNALREGVTIFAIRFGDMKDIHLKDIAEQTGGLVFDASNEKELSDIYLEIRNRVLKEYLLSYRATMIPADRKFVKVSFSRAGNPGLGSDVPSDTRYYYSSVLFGLPIRNLTFLLLIPFLLALAMWAMLMFLRYERPATHPTLEVLHSDQGRSLVKTVPLGTKKTIIGGGEQADLTIIGAPSVKERHATVVYDEDSSSYTVVGEGDIKVNNQRVRSKKLEPGDVINVGGTTIVFDAEDIEKPDTKKKDKK